ncbi:MAG: hypothetical protein AB8G95_02215 [Anaerolineae bacterium]
MNKNKWFATGMGALIALTIGGGIFTFSGVSADEGLVNNISAVITDGVLQDDGEGNNGRRGNRNRGQNSEFLAAELGISVDELTAAREAARDAATDETTREERSELLAAELGITVEELEAANTAAKDAALAEALANGDITQEQIDTKEAQQAFKELFDKKEAAADALGLTVEELEAAKEAGTSKEEILENAGVTQEEVKAAVEEAKAEALADAVESGAITAEQAELIENSSERNGRGNGGNRGNGGRNGGRGNGGQGNGGETEDA